MLLAGLSNCCTKTPFQLDAVGGGLAPGSSVKRTSHLSRPFRWVHMGSLQRGKQAGSDPVTTAPGPQPRLPTSYRWSAGPSLQRPQHIGRNQAGYCRWDQWQSSIVALGDSEREVRIPTGERGRSQRYGLERTAVRSIPSVVLTLVLLNEFQQESRLHVAAPMSEREPEPTRAKEQQYPADRR